MEIEIITETESTFEVDCCVRGYHYLKSFWEASIGSVLVAKT